MDTAKVEGPGVCDGDGKRDGDGDRDGENDGEGTRDVEREGEYDGDEVWVEDGGPQPMTRMRPLLLSTT